MSRPHTTLRVEGKTRDAFNSTLREVSAEQDRFISADEFLNIILTVYRAERVFIKEKQGKMR